MKKTLISILGAAHSAFLCSARRQWPFRPSPGNMASTAICAIWPSRKLNDFGQRFSDNGYQIPGQAGAREERL